MARLSDTYAYARARTVQEVYGPGDQHHLPLGVAKQYKMPDQCWALEYARGNILSMMPFGLADLFFSTLDPDANFMLKSTSGKPQGVFSTPDDIDDIVCGEPGVEIKVTAGTV